MGKKAPKRVLRADFYRRDTHLVAKELLGKFLVRKTHEGEVFAEKITEVEVYDGRRDRASHASRGKTARNSSMFEEAGIWYVYFTYGMHWMLNIVTREAQYPAAILIRSTDKTQGPARITKKMSIGKDLNGKQARKKCGLWIEDRGGVAPENRVAISARIGVAYAGAYWARRKLRFSCGDAKK